MELDLSELYKHTDPSDEHAQLEQICNLLLDYCKAIGGRPEKKKKKKRGVSRTNLGEISSSDGGEDSEKDFFDRVSSKNSSKNNSLSYDEDELSLSVRNIDGDNHSDLVLPGLDGVAGNNSNPNVYNSSSASNTNRKQKKKKSTRPDYDEAALIAEKLSDPYLVCGARQRQALDFHGKKLDISKGFNFNSNDLVMDELNDDPIAIYDNDGTERISRKTSKNSSTYSNINRPSLDGLKSLPSEILNKSLYHSTSTQYVQATVDLNSEESVGK